MIPICDLKSQYQSIKDEIDSAVSRVLGSGRFILDREVAAFEAEFAAYCGVSYCICVGSGTDALYLALRAVGIESKKEVITVANAGVPCVAAIELAKGRPVFVDVEADTLNMDPGRIEEVVCSKTAAILPVHLYGNPVEMDSILEVSGRYGLPVIEDACQAHGARYKKLKVGAIGTAGVFSFYPTKNLSAYGDGGAVVTNDTDIARKVRLMREYGWEPRNRSIMRGVNSRLDELQAAVLRVKLRYLDEWNRTRRALACRYSDLLACAAMGLPSSKPGADPVFHLYVVRSTYRDELQKYLFEEGIQTAVHYPMPVHIQQAYADLQYQLEDLPKTERAALEILSLPLYPELNMAQVETVCRKIVNFQREKRGDEF
jgi:dTDP-4-amino-4,6-dideoxygalactose transaminase